MVDVDANHEKGVNGRNSLDNEKLTLPLTYCEQTPNGGYHYFYRLRKGSCKKQMVGVIPGVDLVLTGVPVAPSIIHTARKDGIYQSTKGTLGDFAFAPEWVQEYLATSVSGSVSISKGKNGMGRNTETSVIARTGQRHWMAGRVLNEMTQTIPVGERNEVLLRYCGQMYLWGCTRETVFKMLEAINFCFCELPLKDAEVKSIYSQFCRLNQVQEDKR